MDFATRPTLLGYGGAVSAGHYHATWIGSQILAAGGNAADAACAMGFALQVLEPTQNGFAGEVPILVWDAREERAFAISGQGTAPARATLEAMRERGVTSIPPDGLLAATVPAAFDAWCRLLERFGTRSLESVLAPARDLAARGFPMYPFLRLILRFCETRFRSEWPTSAAIYLPLREIGEKQTNPVLAEFFDGLIRAERAASGPRETRIRAARDSFYRGWPAEQIERFLRIPVRDGTLRAQAGLLEAADLAAYEGRIEEPLAVDYRGARVWKCGPWSQGPVFLQQLRLLEGFDLAALGAGSAGFFHVWAECAKLAFADRDANYADPRFEKVPLDRLLSDSYTDERRKLVDLARASLDQRPGIGSLPAGWPPADASTGAMLEPQSLGALLGRRDTTQCVAADRDGNLVCATPSGGWLPTSPVIPELGFPIGTRAQMFALDPAHPNVLAPGKRPRTTLSPSLALLPDGRRMAFGTPGGDQQDQWALHFFLALVDFETADLQQAIDAPTLHSAHMPSSFHPHHAFPGALAVESRVSKEVTDELAKRGHQILPAGPWDHGRVLAVTHRDGRFEAAASPRFQIATAAALP